MSKAQILLIALLASTLGACAGNATRTEAAHAYEQRYNADYDADKVAIVTDWAARHGATVVWINYPRKPAHDQPH